MISADADVPPEFAQALHALRDRRLRPEVRLAEVPAPGRIAPWSVALTGEVLDLAGALPGDEDPATGRFVLLHDPAGQVAWDGTFRAVTLVRACLDAEVAADGLLCEAAWTWVTEALVENEAAYGSLGGTVTRVLSQSFGALAERPAEVEVEIRASWTPLGEVGAHLGAWATLLCTAAGLPPTPEGVTALGRRR